MSSKLLTPKETNNPMGRRKDKVGKRIRMGRVMQTNLTMMQEGVKKSLRRKKNFHASYETEII